MNHGRDERELSIEFTRAFVHGQRGDGGRIRGELKNVHWVGVTVKKVACCLLETKLVDIFHIK